jgi:uncharacterized protein YbjT (DUF2867 family)
VDTRGRHVFVTGATGYIGAALVEALAAREHSVRALVRQGSKHRVPRRALPVQGNALDASTFRDAIAPAETFVHLVGTPHPGPFKAQSFRAIDLVSIRAAVDAATYARVRHFVYVSVAHPAPVMAAYIAVRMEGEALVRSAGFDATIVRPWYVLGPGHYWPMPFVPVYWLLERLPPTRNMALRLGLVTIDQLVTALTQAVENPPHGARVLEVPDIRSLAKRRAVA